MTRVREPDRQALLVKEDALEVVGFGKHAYLWIGDEAVSGNYNRKGASAKSGDGLATAVKRYPTPTARDWKSGKASAQTLAKNSRPLSEAIVAQEGHGSLTPEFCEWLMGFPIGWTESVASAMPSSPKLPSSSGGA
jgi:hypothetical protein